MNINPPGDREMRRLIRDLLSNDHTPSESSGMTDQFARQCTAFALDFTAERVRNGKTPVAANDSFPPGNDAA